MNNFILLAYEPWLLNFIVASALIANGKKLLGDVEKDNICQNGRSYLLLLLSIRPG